MLLGGFVPLSAHAETSLQRGAYLVKAIAACGSCHTPRGSKGPLPGMELAGGFKMANPGFIAYSANITPDPATGIGRWTDKQIIVAIRDGRRPDGSIIGPPMPIELYRHMSDRDVKAIVAYLRTVKPVRHKVPKSKYPMPLLKGYGPPVGHVSGVSPRNKLAYGKYLATIAHCIECHTPMGKNGRREFRSELGAGGAEFKGAWEVSIAADITPEALKAFTDAQIKTMITTGVRPDGSKLLPPMPVAYYAHMKAADLDAIVAYLRTLPPR